LRRPIAAAGSPKIERDPWFARQPNSPDRKKRQDITLARPVQCNA
jgi:hypothetical protein